MFISILFTVALLLTIILPVIGYFVGEQTKGRFKRTVIGNVVAFFGVFLLGTVFIFTIQLMLLLLILQQFQVV